MIIVLDSFCSMKTTLKYSIRFPFLVFETYANEIVKLWNFEYVYKRFFNFFDIFVFQNCDQEMSSWNIDEYKILKFEDTNENKYESDMIMSSDYLQRTWKNNFWYLTLHMSVICVLSDHCYCHMSNGNWNEVCISTFFDVVNNHNFKNPRIVIVSVVMMKSDMVNFFS